MFSRRRRVLDAIKRLSRYCPILCVVFGGVGLVCFCSLPFLGKRVSLFENALLSDYAKTHYSKRDSEDIPHLRDGIARSNGEESENYICQSMRSSGFEVFMQNWGTNNTNIHCRFLSLKSDHTEAVLVVIPKSDDKGVKCNVSGLSMMLSFAKYIGKTSHIWAKDIVFVFSDRGSEGISAWMEWYHGNAQDSLKSNGLIHYSGLIQNGIVIDFNDMDNFNNVEYLVLGMVGSEGLLPNLDIPGSVFHAAHSKNVPMSFSSLCNTEANVGWTYMLRNGILHMRDLICSTENYVHSPLSKYRIDSVTLSARCMETHSEIHEWEIVSLVEAFLRNICNLIERLVDSIFIYIFMDNETHIPLNISALIVWLFSSSLAVRCIYLWYTASRRQEQYVEITRFVAISFSIGVLFGIFNMIVFLKFNPIIATNELLAISYILLTSKIATCLVDRVSCKMRLKSRDEVSSIRAVLAVPVLYWIVCTFFMNIGVSIILCIISFLVLNIGPKHYKLLLSYHPIWIFSLVNFLFNVKSLDSLARCKLLQTDMRLLCSIFGRHRIFFFTFFVILWAFVISFSMSMCSEVLLEKGGEKDD